MKKLIGPIVQVFFITLILAWTFFPHFNRSEFVTGLYQDIGLLLISLAIVGSVGFFWKSKLGFCLALIYYFTLVFLAIFSMSFIIVLRFGLQIVPMAFLASSLFVIIKINSKESLETFHFHGRAIAANVGSATIAAIIVMFIFVYLHVT
ncbi:hypothetical protein RT717_20740 [Imperialibacter roseus]|uniref:Uncharacterized protein n=1 Tax=Imperialibacter roseus TaxID=1324217 RepID=A0ABZ0IKF9_9BACT|nr:hypothetical protein [Imperialibacter roseus]WOK05505.1 hypothetical protein RT717_20740 [Imperialibacter roseus]